MTCFRVQVLVELAAGPGPAEGKGSGGELGWEGRRPSPGPSSWRFWDPAVLGSASGAAHLCVGGLATGDEKSVTSTWITCTSVEGQEQVPEALQAEGRARGSSAGVTWALKKATAGEQLGRSSEVTWRCRLTQQPRS